MLLKRITLTTVGIWIALVLVITMAWQVAPAFAGFTPTPIPATNTPIPPTNTPIPPTNTSIPPTATSIAPTAAGLTATTTSIPPTATSIVPTATPDAPTSQPTGTSTPLTPTSLVPTQPPPEDTPEMPVTGGQMSGPSDGGMLVVFISGMMALLIIAITLVLRRIDQNMNKNTGGF